MIAYLAQPIDRARNSNSARQAAVVRTLLIEQGLCVFQPAQAWGSNKTPPAVVQSVNEQALRTASVLVAVFAADDHTFGVPFEIALAREWQIPIVIVTDIQPHKSVMLLHLKAPVFDPHFSGMAAQKAAELAAGPPVPPRQQIAVWQNMAGGVAPRQGKPGDAGFDLTYSGAASLTIEPGEMANVEAGIGVQFPEGVWCLIVGRSSTFQRRMFVAPSVIDAGYRGPLYACVWNIGSESQTIEPGDRVAQIVPFDLVAERYRWIEGILGVTARGASGFGSTGR